MSRRIDDFNAKEAKEAKETVDGCVIAGFVGALAGGLFAALIMAGLLLMKVPTCA